MKLKKSDQKLNRWPFTVNKVSIAREATGAVIVKINLKWYALNGIARINYPELPSRFWRENPAIPGSKIGLGEVIQWGLKYA